MSYNSFFISLFVTCIAVVSFAETRSQMYSRDDMNKNFSHQNIESQEIKIERASFISQSNLTSKELGAWLKESDSDKDQSHYSFVLKVICFEDENDFLPIIPRNRPLTWRELGHASRTRDGSAQIDHEGYVRFSISNSKEKKVDKIELSFNSEKKIVDVKNGPFDLVFRKSTCLAKSKN